MIKERLLVGYTKYHAIIQRLIVEKENYKIVDKKQPDNIWDYHW